MIKILFICHGNICRSPMAYYLMKHKIAGTPLAETVMLDSMATSTEELGNPVYPPARAELSKHGIDCRGHVAKQMKKSDYQSFDVIIAMDQNNVRNLMRIIGADQEGKVHLLSEFAEKFSGDVADPWFYGNFDRTYAEIEDGVNGVIRWAESQM